MNNRTACPCARETTNAVRSTHLVFALLGLAGATWASRLPQIQERMNPDAASVGLLLLLLAVGGLVAPPLAGSFVARAGPRRAVTTVTVAVGAGLGAVASGFAFRPPLLLAGFFVLGTATGFWDVAVSVHAAALERRDGRDLMRTEENTVPTTTPAISVSDADLEDLRARLRATRWPEPWPVDGWEAGTDAPGLRRLVAY